MYEVVYNKNDSLWWIVKDNLIIYELGGFIDPITPKIIILEMCDENEI